MPARNVAAGRRGHPLGTGNVAVLFSILFQSNPTQPHRHHRLLPLAISLTSSNPDDPPNLIFLYIVLDHARDLFDNSPQPVKNFPRDKTFQSFLGLVVDLALTVVKWLSVPVLAVPSLSEMSYCAHERKMRVIPIPFLFRLALAGVMKDTAVDLSEELKVSVRIIYRSVSDRDMPNRIGISRIGSVSADTANYALEDCLAFFYMV